VSDVPDYPGAATPARMRATSDEVQRLTPGASGRRLSYVWDYDLDEVAFQSLLHGEGHFGRLDRDWAAVRLLDYAPYAEIVRLLGFRDLVAGWPRWRDRVRSVSRRRGLDFLVWWLTYRHPDWA